MWAVTGVEARSLPYRKPEINWSLVNIPAHLNLCNNPAMYFATYFSNEQTGTPWMGCPVDEARDPDPGSLSVKANL